MKTFWISLLNSEIINNNTSRQILLLTDGSALKNKSPMYGNNTVWFIRYSNNVVNIK